MASHKEITVVGGRFKGLVFRLEANIKNMPGHEDSLPALALKGNMAAYNALKIDKYTIEDAPFFYGKIDSLGYIISAKDLGL